VNIMEMMSFSCRNLRPEDSIEKAVRLGRELKVDTLPVVDGKEKLIGVFTRSNVYDAVLEGCDLNETIHSYYIREPATLKSYWGYDEVVEAVKGTHVGAGIVVDDEDNVFGVFTKIDMVKEALNQKEILNKKLKAVYGSMHNGLIAFDGHGIIEMANSTACSILNIDENDVVGKPIENYFPDLEAARYTLQQRTEISKKTLLGPVKLIMNITPIIQNEEVIGGLAIFQDISDFEEVAMELNSVKELYLALEMVIDSTYDGIFVTDESARITLVNKNFANFFSLDKEKLMHHDAGSILESDQIAETLRTGIESETIHYIRGNPFVISLKPIFRQTDIAGVIGRIVFKNINEFRSLYEKLEQIDSRIAGLKKQIGHDEKQAVFTFDDMITSNPEMMQLKSKALIAAKGRSNIIIYGESGTGKEVLAQAIHNASFFSRGPFIRINCAAIPENLLESELFGYESGAFTGASRTGKAGKFEQAHNGTIFLDEIGDMPPTLQAKLLRVLQDFSFERIGGSSSITVHTRVIAATNQNLMEKVRKKTFREDLFFRLNVIPFHLPPLNKRREDIIPLCYLFIEKFNHKLGRKIKTIDEDVALTLQGRDWPGNVRELENVIEYSVNYAISEIEMVHLPLYLHYRPEDQRDMRDQQGVIPITFSFTEYGSSLQPFDYQNKVSHLEKEMILRALQSTHGNKSKAAELLGISRSWLYKKMKQLSLKSLVMI